MAYTVDEYKDIIRNSNVIQKTIYDIGLRGFDKYFIDRIMTKERVAEFVTPEFQKSLAGEFYYNMDYVFGIEDVDENGIDRSKEEIESDRQAIIDSLFSAYGDYEDSQYAGWFIDQGAKDSLVREINTNPRKYLNVDAIVDEIVAVFNEEHPNVLKDY